MSRLGDPRIQLSSVHATLGDPGVFGRLPQDTVARLQEDLLGDLPRFEAPPAQDTPALQVLNDIARTLRRIEAHLTRPRWYQRLWATIRHVWS